MSDQGMGLPHDVSRAAWSARTASTDFRCQVFGDERDKFVEQWAGQAYSLVGQALGPFGEEPKRIILPMKPGEHLSGANASYQPSTGQIRLSPSLKDHGVILEKLTHELTHASLVGFPEGDPFYEEAQVDFSVWLLAHAPTWDEYQPAVLKAATDNIHMRRERAMLVQSDWDRKRWAGGVYAALAYGPWLLARLRHKKIENDLTW